MSLARKNISISQLISQSKFRKCNSDSLGITMAYAHFHALDASSISGSFGVTVQLYTTLALSLAPAHNLRMNE